MKRFIFTFPLLAMNAPKPSDGLSLALPGAAYDNKIYAKFSKNTIEKKAENKKKFCEEQGILCEKRGMLIGVVLELTQKNNAILFQDILPGIASLGICLAVRGVGSEKFQQVLTDFSQEYPGKIAILEDNEISLRKIFSATDASFFFESGVENESYAQSALTYASLPIAPKTMSHLIQNYNPNQESGNGFLFEDKNFWSAFAAVVRAHENFRFPYDWKTIQEMALS